MKNSSKFKNSAGNPRSSANNNKRKIAKGSRNKFETRQKDCDATNKSNFDNDISWYNKYPDLLESTARISTGYPIGINYDIMGQSEHHFDLVNNLHTMRLFYEHGIGRTETDRDPVNLAATKLYSYVRHANSGHANYERSDLMLYFLSTIECFNLVAIAARAYGVLQLYNQYNRALPKHVVKAIGWDYEDLVSHATILRTRINNAIARLNSLYIPTELNIMKRWWWLNTNIFVDSSGPKALNYVFTPTLYRTWEEMDSDNGGYLKAYDIPDELNVTQWTQAMNKCLDMLLDSEDIGIMSGDILKAFGDRVFTLNMISEDYTTKFIYSEEVLSQINNTTVLGYSLATRDITQDVNSNLNSGLRYVPSVAVSEAAGYFLDRLGTSPVMNFSVANPGNDVVMVASRNTITAYDIDMDTHTATLSCGSEVITHEKIYGVGTVVEFVPSFLDVDTSVVNILYHNQFDYAPLMKYFDPATELVTVSTSHYENVVPVDERTLERMHDTALLSLFSALV